jgi:hypothetical protein
LTGVSLEKQEAFYLNRKADLVKKEFKQSRKVTKMGPVNIGDDGYSFTTGIKVCWFDYETFKIPRILNPNYVRRNRNRSII